MKEGRHVGGEHGVRGWMECWREGGREIRRKEGRTGGSETPMLSARHGKHEGRKDGREGDTNAQCQAWVMHRSMPVVVSIQSVLTCWWEGLRVVGRARREPGKEGGTSCC